MAAATSKSVYYATRVIYTDQLSGLANQTAQPASTGQSTVTSTIPNTWTNRYGTSQTRNVQTKVMRTDGCAGDTQNDISEYVTKTLTSPDQLRL